jgi:hypothetical protein
MDATHPIIVAEAAEFGKPQNREFSKNACNLLDGMLQRVSEVPTVREGMVGIGLESSAGLLDK